VLLDVEERIIRPSRGIRPIGEILPERGVVPLVCRTVCEAVPEGARVLHLAEHEDVHEETTELPWHAALRRLLHRAVQLCVVLHQAARDARLAEGRKGFPGAPEDPVRPDPLQVREAWRPWLVHEE